jgi:High-temperature-induced dauer-formation protein
MKSIYNLIATSNGNLTSLYPTFLRTMANVSPHLKNLSTITSAKLISLFNSMSSPSFLLAKESNPALLHILLETINNIIEHQHTQNPILLYAIILNHTKFESIQHFDLHKALADIEERKKSKEENKSSSRQSSDPENKPLDALVEITSPVTPVTAFSVGDEDDEEEEEVHETKPLSEKARGKLPEGVEIPRRESALSIHSSSGLLSPSVERKEFQPTDSWVLFLLEVNLQ